MIYFFLLHYFGLDGLFITHSQQQFILSELEKIIYYQNLSKVGKNYFYHRTVVFILNKHFFGDGIKLSDEIKIYISACTVQLTFRIRGFYIEHIQLIRVFPKAMWSQLVQHEVKGLTTGGGVMWLSWEDLKKGFEFPQDGINLGIHEMAHAFKLSLGCEKGFTNRFCNAIEIWRRNSSAAFKRLQNGEENFFRSYGATNMEEFWAVSVEVFFEQPDKLLLQYPEIYFSLCKVFNQNPLNIDSDYRN